MKKSACIIGIDCRFASSRTGLGRYTRELVGALLAMETPFTFKLFVLSKNEQWFSPLPTSLPQAQIIEAPFPHYSFSEQLSFPGVIRRSGIDLFFAPHFNVPLACPVSWVMTVHDLILHRFPNRASAFKQAGYRFLLRRAVSGATGIITVSDFTARELADAYGNRIAEKMSVIHEGVSPLFSMRIDSEIDQVKKTYALSKPYFLYVGNAKEHKNVPTLLNAFSSLLHSPVELVLVMNGDEAHNLSLPLGVRLLTNVPDSDLPALYSGALAFVTATLYEGFCLPILEAEACGCPVIATRAGAIPEVADASAVLVETTAAALFQAFKNDIAHPRARRPAVRFHWSDAAEETMRVLTDALSS